MEPFQLDKRSNAPGLLWLQAWVRDIPGLSAGFTTRIGGVGEAAYTSLNVALHVGDDSEAVVENRRRVSAAAGFPFEAWTCGEQVHSNAVRVIGPGDKGAGRLTREDAIADTDAFITDETGILLAAFYADCVPILFVDPANRAIGLAHAGWKGTALQIAERTIQRMEDAFGSRPSELLAAIGPSIGGCCYEVDERVMSQVGIDSPKPKENGRYMLDLKEVNRQFMIRTGMKPNHIEHSGYCTCCSTDLFFSHRGENGRTGRMAAWIGWKEEVNS